MDTEAETHMLVGIFAGYAETFRVPVGGGVPEPDPLAGGFFKCMKLFVIMIEEQRYKNIN